MSRAGSNQGCTAKGRSYCNPGSTALKPCQHLRSVPSSVAEQHPCYSTNMHKMLRATVTVSGKLCFLRHWQRGMGAHV